VSRSADEIYRGILFAQLPRVLGQIDREPLSPTWGCGDRTYWAWKFVDFPAPRFQEAVCVMAWAWATRKPGGVYYRDANLLEWIEAALRWWTRRQHSDGSFDEAYPFERSLAATSFTAFYVSEALRLLGDHLSRDVRARVVESVARAAHWLTRNDETHGFLSNHLAAALGACWHAYELTREPAFARRASHFRDKILGEQSSEGWYREYDGADPGYQTHGSFYLARYAELAGDESVSDSLERSFAFLAHFVHVDGSLGGEYASRNTQTHYPAAFEMCAPRSPTAAWIARRMRPSLETAAAAGPASVDAWNQYPMLNNLVFAQRAVDGRAEPPAHEPDREHAFRVFPEAGLLCVRHPAYDAVLAFGKGGVLKVWDRGAGRLAYSDCGWVARTARGRLLATQSTEGVESSSIESDAVEVAGRAAFVSRPTFTPFTFVAFRAFSTTIGRFALVARQLKNALVHVLIRRRLRAELCFRRRVEFGATEVRISDRLWGGERVVEVRRAHRFATLHMGSSRYFVANELRGSRDESGAADRVDPEELRGGVSRERRISFS
jgi:hypothetical protein